MADNTTYTTIDGERWDTVAFKAYGDPNQMSEIIAANPDVPIYDRLPGGIVLQMPVLQQPTNLTNSSLLPPWKQ